MIELGHGVSLEKLVCGNWRGGGETSRIVFEKILGSTVRFRNILFVTYLILLN